jgi:hypothetical protein
MRRQGFKVAGRKIDYSAFKTCATVSFFKPLPPLRLL